MLDALSAFHAALTELQSAVINVSLVTHAPRASAHRSDSTLGGQTYQVSLFRGHGQVMIGADRFEVDRQLLALVPPGVSHAAVQNGRDLASLNLQFTAEVVAMRGIPAFCVAPSPDSRAARLERDFQIILEDWQMAEAGAQSSINARAKSLLIDVLRLWTQSGGDTISPAVVESACRYMAVQYGKALTMRDVAAHCGVRADSLCRAFRRHLATSPRGYLLELRLRQARSLLLAGLSVTEVAEQTGFGSVHYFSRAFKRAEGHSPTDWRRLNNTSQPFEADQPAGLPV